MKYVTQLNNYFKINPKLPTLRELGKINTKIYWQTHAELDYSDFGSEFNIESLSEPIKKTLSKFESDNVKEHWRKYGDWVYWNKKSYKYGSQLFQKGEKHERHLSKQRIEFELYDYIQKGKDVIDKETGVSIENKNVECVKSQKLIKFRLWNLNTKKIENLDEVLERKIKNKENADIYIFSDENMTLIIPSKLFIHNKEYHKHTPGGIDIHIPYSKCKAVWIRDPTKEIDKTQEIINTKELYEKYLDDTGPKI